MFSNAVKDILQFRWGAICTKRFQEQGPNGQPRRLRGFETRTGAALPGRSLRSLGFETLGRRFVGRMGSRGYVSRYPPEPHDHSDHGVLRVFEPRTGAALPGRSLRSLGFEAWGRRFVGRMGSRGYVFRYPPEPHDHSDHGVLRAFEPRTGAALPGRSLRSLGFEAWAGDVWDG